MLLGILSPTSARSPRTNQSCSYFKQQQSKDYFVSTPQSSRINTLDSSSSNNSYHDENISSASRFSERFDNQCKGFYKGFKIKRQSVLLDNGPRRGKKLEVGSETNIVKNRNKSTEPHEQIKNPRLNSMYQMTRSLRSSAVRNPMDDIQTRDHKKTDPRKQTNKPQIKSKYQKTKTQTTHSLLARNRHEKNQPHDYTERREKKSQYRNTTSDQACFSLENNDRYSSMAVFPGDDKYNSRRNILNSKSDNQRQVNGYEPMKGERQLSCKKYIKYNDMAKMKYPISSLYLNAQHEKFSIQPRMQSESTSRDEMKKDQNYAKQTMNGNAINKPFNTAYQQEVGYHDKNAENPNEEDYDISIQNNSMEGHQCSARTQRNRKGYEQKGQKMYELCSNEKRDKYLQSSLLEDHSGKSMHKERKKVTWKI